MSLTISPTPRLNPKRFRLRPDPIRNRDSGHSRNLARSPDSGHSRDSDHRRDPGSGGAVRRPGSGHGEDVAGPSPGNPQFQPPPDLNARVQQFQAQSGGQAVYLTFSGIPTNSDPARGVTARDVSEAIRERARTLAPSVNRFSWISRNNTSVLMMSPVDDIPGLASRIDFGTATVSGNQISVQIAPDYVASVPRLPAEQPR
jgi:hypothetical protein